MIRCLWLQMEVSVTPGLSVTSVQTLNICVRAGCNNPAVESDDWDKEYCSNECVATHCRYVHTVQCRKINLEQSLLTSYNLLIWIIL